MKSQIKKSEEDGDKEILSVLSYTNTKSKSKTFGEVELKYISSGDVNFFDELLDKIDDNKEFVIRVLYHQLIAPKVSFKKFRKIPDDELIDLSRDFIKQEQDTFEYFKETTDANFFNNFREAIQTYSQKRFERLQTTFKPIIDSIESNKMIFENFNKKYRSIIKQAFDFSEMMENISKFAEKTRGAQLLLANVGESLENALILSEVLIPKIQFWQEWIEQNKRLFDNYTKFWQIFQKQYKITEQEAIQILRKYKWFITLSLPESFIFEVVKIGGKPGNQRRAVNRLFVNYFSSNNFINLKTLVDGWETNAIFKPRMKIFRDCIFIMRNAKGRQNPSNCVLPTLIAQIDGIRLEFMKRNGLSFWKKDKVWKKLFKDQTPNQDLSNLANDIFLNILFQKSQQGLPLEIPFTFNRHKIMHGEYLKYGRIDNTIRAFLILDFLSSL